MMHSQTITDQDMRKIKEEMLQNAGVDLVDFKTPFLLRRINARMMSVGVKQGSEYAHLLSQDPLEALNLYNSLSINVTECFRDPKVWNVFSNEIIPQILDRAKVHGTINVWSAGCATGQEPYSLAIMFAEAIGNKNIKFEITATDMNKVSINIAKTGRYDPKSIKKIPPPLIPKYFEKLDDEIYQIRANIKNSIKFGIGDVLSFPIDTLDVIVCRNLLIYYGREAQELLFKKFYKSLKPSGFVVLGMDETMIGTEGTKLFKATHPRERIFQRNLI